MEVKIADTFWKSFKRTFNPNIFEMFSDWFYDFKNGIKNLIRYRKIVYRTRPWDYEFIIKMLDFQLRLLHNQINVYGQEIDETRIPKIKRMERVLELLNYIEKDNFSYRCGYIDDATNFEFLKPDANGFCGIKFITNPKYPDYDQAKIFKEASELEEKEWNELFEIFKTDMRGWWD